jgi:hypothetical protein
MNAELIIYDASDGIENALYPGRWTVISTDSESFASAAKAASNALDFFFTELQERKFDFAVKTGNSVTPYA